MKADKAKTAKRRIVRIQPNLAKWLAPYGENRGAVVPVNARKKLDAVRKAAGLKRWSKNGLRHSFASYRLAATNEEVVFGSDLARPLDPARRQIEGNDRIGAGGRDVGV